MPFFSFLSLFSLSPSVMMRNENRGLDEYLYAIGEAKGQGTWVFGWLFFLGGGGGGVAGLNDLVGDAAYALR